MGIKKTNLDMYNKYVKLIITRKKIHLKSILHVKYKNK